jgi:hypothetical protein
MAVDTEDACRLPAICRDMARYRKQAKGAQESEILVTQREFFCHMNRAQEGRIRI